MQQSLNLKGIAFWVYSNHTFCSKLHKTAHAKQHAQDEKKHRERAHLKKVLAVNIGLVSITFVAGNRKLHTFSKALNRI